MSSATMDAHERWCRSVIDSLDLEVDHIIIAFGLPSPIIVSWAHRSMWKPLSSPKTPMILGGCQEERERCGDGSENPPMTCGDGSENPPESCGDDLKDPPESCGDGSENSPEICGDDLKDPPEICGDDFKNPRETTCVEDLKKPRGFWRRTKKRLSDIFRAVCICGCATHHTQ
jgi:hypothetical protein